MLFIAYDCDNKAIWNALKIHISFVAENGESLSFLVDKRYRDIVQQDYPDVPIYTYANALDLMIKLFKIKEKKLFSPVMFTTIYALFPKIFHSKEIYYWVQGTVPEESFLRHESKLRYYVLSTIEFFALSIANKKIFVSDEMQRYLEHKYHRRYKQSIIVPCVSEFEYDGSVKEKDSFVYIGGMSAWQRVDVMLEMFNDILHIKPKAVLYLATLETETTTELVQQYVEHEYQTHVHILSITDREEIPRFLSTKEYGFLIRDDIVVNQVSSPIKLAEYLSCGVNVIISSAVKSYASLIEKEEAGIKLEDPNTIIDKLQNFSPNCTNAIHCYATYFSKQKHTRSYGELLEQ